MPCQNLTNSLTKFKENFSSKKVIDKETELIYQYKDKADSYRYAFDANILIDKLRLPLVAICSDFYPIFTVQSNETES